jgi:hypothetical protein
MRFLTVSLALAVLALAPTAAAGPLDRETAGNGSKLSLYAGHGIAIVKSDDGAILGTIYKGTIIVRDPLRGPRTAVTTSGCKRHRIDSITFSCAGRNISFSVVDGTWKVTLRGLRIGSRINASAVVTGWLRLQGTSGTFAIDNGRRRAWPRTWRTFELG